MNQDLRQKTKVTMIPQADKNYEYKKTAPEAGAVFLF